jgi:hypothetical protein
VEGTTITYRGELKKERWLHLGKQRLFDRVWYTVTKRKIEELNLKFFPRWLRCCLVLDKSGDAIGAELVSVVKM